MWDMCRKRLRSVKVIGITSYNTKTISLYDGLDYSMKVIK